MSTVPLDPVTRVLLLTAGPDANDAAIAPIAGGAGFGWYRLLERCEQKGVTGVAWRRLQRIGVRPPDVVTRHAWQQAALRADHRTLAMGAACDALLERIAAAGLRPVLLKGGALSRLVYARRVDRPMLDQDILLAPGAAAEAMGIARAAGWRPALEADAAALEGFFSAHHHLVPLREPRSGAQVELHTELFHQGHPFPTMGGEAVAARARFGAKEVPDGVGVPTDVDLLLHLALHFAWSHGMGSGIWRASADVQALGEAGRIDWPALPGHARGARASTACFWTLHLARALAGVRVPDAPLDALRGGFIPAAALGPLSRHFAWHCSGVQGSCPSVALSRRLWRIGMRPRRSGHGDQLPWEREHLFPGYHLVPTPESAAERLGHAGRQLPRFVRYAAALLS